MRALLVFLTREVMKGICYFYFFTSYYDTIDIRQLRLPTIFAQDQIPHSSPTYQVHHPQTHEYYLVCMSIRRRTSIPTPPSACSNTTMLPQPKGCNAQERPLLSGKKPTVIMQHSGGEESSIFIALWKFLIFYMWKQ